MPQTLRIRVAIGICTCLGGFAFSVVAPIVAFFLLVPDIGGVSFEAQAENLPAMISQMAETGQTLVGLRIAGLCVSSAGFLLAFITWLRWFVRPDSVVELPGDDRLPARC
jgi:hypothetical protein